MKIKTVRNLTLALAATTMIGCAAETEEAETQDDEQVVTVQPAAPKITPKKCGSWGCDSNHNPRRVARRSKGRQ